MSSKYFELPGRTSKLRVAVRATSAVFGGVIPKARIPLLKKPLRTQDFKKMPCSLLLVDASEVNCEIDRDERMAYIVRDGRAEGTMATGALGIFKGSHKLTERAALPNKIQIFLSAWQCVENCKKVD